MSNTKNKVVNDIQSYLKKNIQNKISLLDISRSINYSLWYTARIFKEIMGITIFEYIRRLRLTKAAIRLRDTSSKVIDVALDFVFDSHEGFTRAFAKEFHITPKTYQISPIPLQYFTPYNVVDNSNRKGVKTTMSNKAVFVQIVERPKRKAIIKRGVKATDYFEYCEEVDCSIWGVLCSIKEAISEPVGMWLSKKLQKPNTSMYVQGVEVPEDYSGIVPENCELIDLPETQMLIFQGETYDDEFFEDEVSEVMKFVAKYNPKVHGYEYDESGYRFQYEPQGYRGYIEGRTIKKIK